MVMNPKKMAPVRNPYKRLVVELGWMRIFQGTSSEWKDNMRMQIKEMDCMDVGWVNLAQDRVHWQALVKMSLKVRNFFTS
jgi:hypothetical protein